MSPPKVVRQNLALSMARYTAIRWHAFSRANSASLEEFNETVKRVSHSWNELHLGLMLGNNTIKIHVSCEASENDRVHRT